MTSGTLTRDAESVTITLNSAVRAREPSWRQYGIIPLPASVREFFPGYKVPFVIELDEESYEAWVSSGSVRTRIGATEGGYLSGVRKSEKRTKFPGLTEFYRRHDEVEPGSRLVFRTREPLRTSEVEEPLRRYSLQILGQI